MSTITKERVAEFIKNPLDNGLTRGEQMELARIALASLEAEAVCVIDQSNLDYLKSGSDADVWPASRTEMGDVLLYRTVPPAPVSVPDEAIRSAVDEIMATYAGSADECRKLVRKHIEDACRAAMLQGADGNSPVIPEGWVLVPEEPTHEMLEAGDEQFGTYDVYRRMIAASPQQEVKP
ncbi:TPA: hypothetical protein ACXEMS_000239 [Enterobacter ludwigii]